MAKSAKVGARFQVASDQSLLVYFDHSAKRSGANDSRPQYQFTIETHHRVRRLLRLLELEPIAGVRNLHPAYSSVLIKFDAFRLRHEQLEEILRSYIQRMEQLMLPEPRLVEIPVCYGGDHGPDLNDVAKLRGLTPEKVIALHGSQTFIVYFLGFVPGFAYLGKLPEELATPRLATPRRSVPAGSVGIAGSQTGVYPISTPGGWRLLGRTPLSMFRPQRSEMSLLSIGDRVRFVPISSQQFAKLELENA
ncbi:MAG: 5-oxoprolinase subunit PxpB [Candidatus Acidiferrum sp.]